MTEGGGIRLLNGWGRGVWRGKGVAGCSWGIGDRFNRNLSERGGFSPGKLCLIQRDQPTNR